MFCAQLIGPIQLHIKRYRVASRLQDFCIFQSFGPTLQVANELLQRVEISPISVNLVCVIMVFLFAFKSFYPSFNFSRSGSLRIG